MIGLSVLAHVILDIPTQTLEGTYRYAVPAALAEQVTVGVAVEVPFGHRKALGFVVGLGPDQSPPETEEPAELTLFGEEAPTPPARRPTLEPIEAVLGGPYFDTAGAACAAYLAERYVAPLANCIRLFTPPSGIPRVVRRDGAWVVEAPAIHPIDDRWVAPGPEFDEYTPPKRAAKQRAILDALAAGPLKVSDLTAEFGSVSSSIDALSRKGVVIVENRRRQRDVAPTEISWAKPTLTPGQARALAVIGECQRRAVGEVVLVDGVTGSGKTEVYLQAIEEALAAGFGAITLVPEISLTPQTVARFRSRFGDTVAVLHSRMSAGERYDSWDRIRSGQARVVVGARSALFAPVARLGLIIIDEEHETTYKQESAPRYLARDVACWMMKERGGVVALGSATPSIEALHACDTDPGWHRVSLPERANGRPMPEITVVDLAAEFRAGRRSMFSRPLTDAILSQLTVGNKVVLLLNQRGFAQFLLCRDCGFVPTCPSCSTSLTYHEYDATLQCHHCDYKIPAPLRCPNCESPYLKRFGAGTERVEQELRRLLQEAPGELGEVPIIRMDSDTTKTKGAHERLLLEFSGAERAILLGTQMIAKGLDFDDVTLVGVINADTQLHLPDYRAAERTFDLIEQVAGRAGRGAATGSVIVQTYEATTPAIVAAARYDRQHFLDDELPKRRLLGYPPYRRMANLILWGEELSEVRATADTLHHDLLKILRREGIAYHEDPSNPDGWQVLPPAPCVLSRLRGHYRWHCVIKAPPMADLSTPLRELLRDRTPTPTVNVAVDIDPTNLL